MQAARPKVVLLRVFAAEMQTLARGIARRLVSSAAVLPSAVSRAFRGAMESAPGRLDVAKHCFYALQLPVRCPERSDYS